MSDLINMTKHEEEELENRRNMLRKIMFLDMNLKPELKKRGLMKTAASSKPSNADILVATSPKHYSDSDNTSDNDDNVSTASTNNTNHKSPVSDKSDTHKRCELLPACEKCHEVLFALKETLKFTWKMLGNKKCCHLYETPKDGRKESRKVPKEKQTR